MTRRDVVTARFQAETVNHQMTVLRDDGLYRHLRFRDTFWRPPLAAQQTSSFYRFDLITVPGTLVFQGDGDSWVFSRTTDMFEFFRSPSGQINPPYWAEKLTAGRNDCMRYDPELFEQRVMEAYVEAAEDQQAPRGTAAALRGDVLPYAQDGEDAARRALDDFEHAGFRFYDTWEWSFRDYDWWFLWSLHAIVWGISVYDGKPITSWPGPDARPAPRPAPPEVDFVRTVGGLRRVETVAATGGVL